MCVSVDEPRYSNSRRYKERHLWKELGSPSQLSPMKPKIMVISVLKIAVPYTPGETEEELANENEGGLDFWRRRLVAVLTVN